MSSLLGDDVGPGLLAGKKTLPSFLAPPPVLLRPAPGDKGTFSKIGANLLFESVPSVVHFGGYALNKVHEQTVRVRCLSAAAAGERGRGNAPPARSMAMALRVLVATACRVGR